MIAFNKDGIYSDQPLTDVGSMMFAQVGMGAKDERKYVIDRRALGKAAVSLAFVAALGRPGALRAAPSVAFDPLPFVNPELRNAARQMLAMAAQMPPPSIATLPEARARNGRYALPVLPEIPVSARSIAVKNSPDVGIYVINAKRGAARPAILHTHGGGFISGTAKSSVRNMQDVAQALDCVVVTVEYRLAPETRWYGSLDDNYAGLKWLHDHAAELGVDTARIAVMGESAGGGHAAMLALRARDRGEVPIVFQALIYPMLDDRTGSTRKTPVHIGAIGWNASLNRFGWRSFLGQEPGGRTAPAGAVPARVAELAGLPPAFIGVGSIDLFVDEDLDYARRLVDAGVSTELHVVPGAFHSFDKIGAETAVARDFTAAKLNALRRAFRRDGAKG